jgi:dihydropteroate synthase
MLSFNLGGRLWQKEITAVMGILNITPDSFYDGSRVYEKTNWLGKAEQMILEGADILDIGGQSTRPGSERISAEEECKRVLPAIASIRRAFPQAILSIDTYHAQVASAAVKAGADLVNDISGGSFDATMIPTVAGLGVPYICMHTPAKPEHMQSQTQYENLFTHLLDFFIERIRVCRSAGIKDLVVDPGFGFGKTISQNFQLVKNLRIFRQLQTPVLLGVSRKSTIYKTLETDAGRALNGTTVLHTIALLQGVDILRVHDIREAREAIKLVDATGQA